MFNRTINQDLVNRIFITNSLTRFLKARQLCYLLPYRTATPRVNKHQGAEQMLLIVSLACVSGETHNLQRVFRPRGGGSPLYRLYRYVPRQKVFFSRFGLK